jgi:hypothetical protein
LTLIGEVVSTKYIGAKLAAVFVTNGVQITGGVNELVYSPTYLLPGTPLTVTTGYRLIPMVLNVAELLVTN